MIEDTDTAAEHDKKRESRMEKFLLHNACRSMNRSGAIIPQSCYFHKFELPTNTQLDSRQTLVLLGVR